MSADAASLSRLVALIDEARSHASALGAVGGNALHHLDAALGEAKALVGRGGEADEGLRLDELTTDNDK